MTQWFNIRPADVDLVKTIAPRGLEVQIEGVGKTWKVNVDGLNLASAIIHAYVLLTGYTICDTRRFVEFVTVKEFDVNPSRIRVAIKSH